MQLHIRFPTGFYTQRRPLRKGSGLPRAIQFLGCPQPPDSYKKLKVFWLVYSQSFYLFRILLYYFSYYFYFNVNYYLLGSYWRIKTRENHLVGFSSVTPLNLEVGSSLMSLITIWKGLVRIVSPFQKSSGCMSGQNFTQPSDLVKTSLGLRIPSICTK